MNDSAVQVAMVLIPNQNIADIHLLQKGQIMIIGIGVDVVDIARFGAVMDRTPRLVEKLFTPLERDLALSSLAARFAAKEAIAKALGSPGTLHWHDVTIARVVGKCPVIDVSGSVAQCATELGVTSWHLSLSHDGGLATAMVVAEGA